MLATKVGLVDTTVTVDTQTMAAITRPFVLPLRILFCERRHASSRHMRRWVQPAWRKHCQHPKGMAHRTSDGDYTECGSWLMPPLLGPFWRSASVPS
jgi:hypothetical protein